MTNCVIYIRVSTTKQEAKNQELQLVAYAGKSGWKVSEIYSDVITGKEDKRSAYDALFQAAHKKLFDIVLFWDLSRFSRSGTLFTLQKLKELDNLGIAWVSYQESYINSMGQFKDVVISIFATLNKIEAERISERTKAGLERAKAEGKTLGKRPRKYDFNRIWKEYRNQGSINKASKVLPYGYGTIQFIINHNIQDQESYEALIRKGV